MKGKTALILATALTLPCSLHAADEALYAGLFVGEGSTGSGEMKGVINDGSFASGIDADSSDTAFSIYFGSKINRSLGIELAYANFGEFSASGMSTGSGVYAAGPVKGTLKTDAFTASVLGLYHPTQKFGLLGRLGAYRASASVSRPVSGAEERSFGGFLGLGAEFTLDYNLFARFEWTMYSDVDYADVNGDTQALDIETIGASLALVF